jgi:thioredoxin
MSDSTVHLTEQNFDETLAQHDGLLMVDFWAEWCGPCKAIAPVLEELARDAAGRLTLAKVNVDENHGLAARYGIRSSVRCLVRSSRKSWPRWASSAPSLSLASAPPV